MINNYLKLLYPEIPAWLKPYLDVPCLTRLKGIGLFCGVDYSCLFHPHTFYSRYDHSVGVALIIWRFTKNKEATLAGLFHDVSTPVFSHAIDFKNKDYLNQESTEKENAQMILKDEILQKQLQKDNIDPYKIIHDSDYPIANLKTPKLCADRLEYMFATGYFLTDSFNLASIEKCIDDIEIQNEGELGFKHQEIATHFFHGCLVNTKLFLKPYDKITLQILANITDLALEKRFIYPEDLYQKSEIEIINIFKNSIDSDIQKLYHLLTKQTIILTQETEMENAFCMKIDVKRRYVDPLIKNQRLSSIDLNIKKEINDLFITNDEFICVPYIK